MPRGTLDPAALASPSPTGLSPPMAGLPRAVRLAPPVACAVRTPPCTHGGLGSSGSARRYSRNRFFFLFLRLLRCFSSPGSPRGPMCSAWGGGVFPRRVSPFRHPRIDGYVPLPAAFRSLSRLSSAPGAKASALCPSSLNRSLPPPRLAWRFLGSSRALARLLWIPVPCAAPMGALPPASRRHFSLLDVRWGLPHRLVLFVSIRFSRYSWRPLPPMGLSGLEPPTSRLSGVRSNRLSYKPMMEMEGIEPLTPCLQGRCSPS